MLKRLFCRCAADCAARRGNDCSLCAKAAQDFCVLLLSPSPRRAWIEIPARRGRKNAPRVALPTEGVDRNHRNGTTVTRQNRSPSPRRAWIEIALKRGKRKSSTVALPTEGVDRNVFTLKILVELRVALPTEGVDRNIATSPYNYTVNRRPPHGGRG